MDRFSSYDDAIQFLYKNKNWKPDNTPNNVNIKTWVLAHLCTMFPEDVLDEADNPQLIITCAKYYINSPENLLISREKVFRNVFDKFLLNDKEKLIKYIEEMYIRCKSIYNYMKNHDDVSSINHFMKTCEKKYKLLKPDGDLTKLSPIDINTILWYQVAIQARNSYMKILRDDKKLYLENIHELIPDFDIDYYIDQLNKTLLDDNRLKEIHLYACEKLGLPELKNEDIYNSIPSFFDALSIQRIFLNKDKS